MRKFLSFAGFCLTTIPFLTWTLSYCLEADWSSKNPFVIFPWEWALHFARDVSEPVPYFIMHLAYTVIYWHHVIITERERKFQLKFCWTNILGCFLGQAFVLPLTTQGISEHGKLTVTVNEKKEAWKVHIYLFIQLQAAERIWVTEGNYLIISVLIYALIAPICFGFAVEGKVIRMSERQKFLWVMICMSTIIISLWRAVLWVNFSFVNFLHASIGNWPSFCLMFDGIILIIFGVYTLVFESHVRNFYDVQKEA